MQTSISDQPAQTDKVRHCFRKQSLDPGKVEGRHFEQSARMCRSVRVFAVATFRETLIKCLFFNENKAYMNDKNTILTPDHARC